MASDRKLDPEPALIKRRSGKAPTEQQSAAATARTLQERLGNSGTQAFMATTLQPSPPKKAPCQFPKILGVGRVCDPKASDMRNFDFPKLSPSSLLKLQQWASAHFPPRKSRSEVTDKECMEEMAAVLTGLGGSAGAQAFAHFVAGGGKKVVLYGDSPLGALTLKAPSFAATVATVKAAIEKQLAAQASNGALDACALTVKPPPTFFLFSDAIALKAVIGGTQGEALVLTSFDGNLSKRTYSIGVGFVICDHFGVDESDLYAPGLYAFWVLQHERSASRFRPFLNELVLPLKLSGSF